MTTTIERLDLTLADAVRKHATDRPHETALTFMDYSVDRSGVPLRLSYAALDTHAMALAGRPKLIIADEPTGNVDAAMAERILHLLTAMNRLGTTVIVATHDVGLIAATPGAQLIRLEKGALVDPTGALRHPPQTPLRAEGAPS